MKYIVIFSSFLVICNNARKVPNLESQEDVSLELDYDFEEEYIEVYDPKYRIMGGETTLPNAFPYQVGMTLIKNNGHKGWGGGSLISNRYVITAAHCLDRTLHATVYLGMYDRKVRIEPGRINQTVPACNFIIHQEWTSATITNDIGLVKLKTEVIFNAKIQPIALPSRSDTNKTFEDDSAIILGWGHYDSTTVLARYLQYATGKVLSNIECGNYFVLLQPTNICMDENFGSMCNGDSGGPLVTESADGEPLLIGVASFAPASSCQKPWASGYTRITSYIDWISQNAGITIE